MGSFFYYLREVGTSNLIPAAIQGDSISPFHDEVWELQMEDKISSDKVI